MLYCQVRPEGALIAMKQKVWALLSLLALGFAAAATAQVGHPAKGSWLGYWGPSEDEQRRLRLLLDWENRQIVGTVNPGRNGVTISQTQIDYDTWTLTFEAEMPTADGEPTQLVATGVLDNLGSWTNRRYMGTYVHGDEEGTFTLFLN